MIMLYSVDNKNFRTFQNKMWASSPETGLTKGIIWYSMFNSFDYLI